MDVAKAAQAALEKRARAWEQRKAVMDDPTLTDADRRSRVEAIDAEMAALEQEARSHIQLAEREAEARELNERAARLTGGTRSGRPEVRDEAAELRALARGQVSEVEFDLRTAQSGVPENAGNTKATTFVAQVIQAMRERSAFFGLARVVTTSGGETMEWPVKNGIDPATPPVSNVGRVAENTTYPKGDQSWSMVNIGAYKYGVIVEATEEIATDSALPILSIVATDAGEAVADYVLTDLLVGDGTNKPWGWITRATGGVNAADLSFITFDNMMDLQYSLTAPYRRNGIYLVSDLAVATLRKLKDNEGRYLWAPAVTAGEQDTILGKPVLTDPNVPTAGAGSKVALFGDPSRYLIRQVRSMRVVRSDEYGYDRDVIAFKVTWRGSGDLFDLNSVKALTVDA